MKNLQTLALLCACATFARAGESPYFVTYTQQLEEPGNLEFESKTALGKPSANDRFLGTSGEFEYGLTGWWTVEFYLDHQFTNGQGGRFVGNRWENRFRLTRRYHWINPVLYAEFENTSDADKSLLEVVGHDSADDLRAPNSVARLRHQHEAELKLLLGTNFKGWNLSENFIGEKNLGHEPWEFGYAVGVARPLTLVASPAVCNFCAENFTLGVEAYGGLGDASALTLRDTSHYIASVVAWTLANGIEFKASPGFGVTQTSLPFLLRVGVSYELPQIARLFRR